jgi:hypothetical protein
MLRSAFIATVLALAAVGELSGCGYASSGPQPFVVCGTTLPNSPNLVYEALGKSETINYDPSQGICPSSSPADAHTEFT